MDRQATEERQTAETDIRVVFGVDGRGNARIDTPVAFVNHMLELFAKHGFFDLEVKATGDIEVDAHHTLEDLGLVLGAAIRQALGDKHGIRRYGFFILPMDETLVRVALDLSGRPCLEYQVQMPEPIVGGISARLFHEFFQALTNALGLNLHIDLIRGEENHHIIEAIFKAFGKALDIAARPDPRQEGVPSTKGVLD